MENALSTAIKRQEKLPRFLCHLYQRLKQNHLNLVLGAGISIDAGVPSWFGLLERLSECEPTLQADFTQHKSDGLSPEYLGQIIYHRHRHVSSSSDSTEATINHCWADSIHKAIYKQVPKSIEEIIRSHPYLNELRKLTLKVPLVINFNFDDILAESIAVNDSISDGNRYSIVWQPPLIDRPKHTTIYHVNGVLPRISLKKRSPQLIFTEDSFADAFARSPGVSAEYLFLRFVQNSMLIIGHSLADVSLKNYLRRNRDKSPANHHYMIYWLKDDNALSSERQSDIFEANLELYNIFTIFLTSNEINAFLGVLSLDERDFRDVIDKLGEEKRSRYHYYIVGPVAAGKSTILEHLRCFETYEEWTRPVPSEMYRSFETLSKEESEKVDAFIYSELKEKNSRMNDAGVGFHFMDRAPLDLYAFSKNKDECKQKTAKLKELVIRDKPFQNGEVIFIHAQGETLIERNLGRGRPPSEAGSVDYLEEQKNKLKEIYNPAFLVSTDACEPGAIAKKIVRHAILEKYSPIDLNSITKKYS